MRKWALKRVMRIMASRGPDFIVGELENPYLKRWRLLPKSIGLFFNIYAHEFFRSDDDVPHDHPYLFCVSWILHRGYWERTFPWWTRDYRYGLTSKLLWEGALHFRWGWKPHRVELVPISFAIHSQVSKSEYDANTLRPITLFFCGPRVREWGFHCPNGWRRWQDYIAPTSYGNRVGKGCGEQ